jgi:hypothetical protein
MIPFGGVYPEQSEELSAGWLTANAALSFEIGFLSVRPASLRPARVERSKHKSVRAEAACPERKPKGSTNGANQFAVSAQTIEKKIFEGME